MKKKISFVIVGVVLALIAGEIIIRIFSSQKTYSDFESYYTFSCYTEGEFHWLAFKPDSSCMLIPNFVQMPPTIIRTNSIGLRNEEIPKNSADTYRILFLGDSFVAGLGMDEDYTLPKQVERLVKQKMPGKKIEVINAGLISADSSYYYLFLKHTDTFSYDAIVIGTYIYNDIYDPELQMVWTEIDANNLPLRVDSQTLKITSDGNLVTKHIPIHFQYPLLRNSHLLTFLENIFFSTILKPKEKKTARGPAVCLHKKSCHDLDGEKQKTERLYRGIAKIADEKNVPLLIVLIPAKYQIYPESRIEYNIYVPLSPEELDYPNTYLTSFFEKEQIASIDLLEAFRENKEKELFYIGDPHFNYTGTSLASEKTAEGIMDAFFRHEE